MRTWVAAGLAALAALGTAGCVLAPVDLEGRPCPCAQGWVCVADVCRREGSTEQDAGGPRDAGPDASLPRDGGADAGAPPVDAGTDAGELDAGERDAGELDASVPDAGPDPTRCDDLHAGALFCDGFEWAYPAGRTGWGWDLLENGNVDTVTSPAPYLGERALRATTTVNGGRAAMGATLPAAQAIVDGDIWLRGFFYFPSSLTVDSVSLLYIGADDGSAGISFQMYDGGQAAVWVGTQSQWLGTGTAMPRDEWTCLQLHVVVAQVGGEVELYVDDLRFGRWTGLDTLPIAADGFRAMEAGIEYSDTTQAPSTLYVDEVVLSRTRVPCE